MRDKLRGHAQRRRQGQEDLVAAVRRYGVFAVAALVLLPPQLIALLAACAAAVYVFILGARRVAVAVRA